ncbi:MAG: bleomycin resistance family protein [Cyanobacteria bacterium P01_D01_bin.36]
MNVQYITPILNVSNLAESIQWFEKLGWQKLWDWGDPPTFGAVGIGEEQQIFLSLNCQGGRGKGDNEETFGPNGDETQDKGVWLSIFVEDVDKVYATALAADIEVVFPPTDLPWNVRECHLRHPDGHVFRIGKPTE